MIKFKINLHILEDCNYHCRHCFAKFGKEKYMNVNKWANIIDNLASVLDIDEINIAGGEPLLYKNLPTLIQYINSKNIKCSIITNGSLLTENWIKNNIPLLSTIGLSIDSFNPAILKEGGRTDKKDFILSEQSFLQIYSWIRKYNPKCKIKINTVVSSINKKEILLSILKKHNIHIDKWKILKMSVFENEYFSNKDIQISDEDFNNYIINNMKSLNISYNTAQSYNNLSKIIIYNNTIFVIEKELKNAYLIINPQGYLLRNNNENYSTICNCLNKQELGNRISDINLDKNLYVSRYI